MVFTQPAKGDRQMPRIEYSRNEFRAMTIDELETIQATLGVYIGTPEEPQARQLNSDIIHWISVCIAVRGW